MSLILNRNRTRCSSWLSQSIHVVLVGLVCWTLCHELTAEEKPISILSARIGGHVHPIHMPDQERHAGRGLPGQKRVDVYALN